MRETKNYYCVYDRIAEEYADFFVAKNAKEALRTFNHNLALQFKRGLIPSVDDFELYLVGSFSWQTGKFGDSPSFDFRFQKIEDNESNNSSDEKTEVTINHV